MADPRRPDGSDEGDWIMHGDYPVLRTNWEGGAFTLTCRGCGKEFRDDVDHNICDECWIGAVVTTTGEE